MFYIFVFGWFGIGFNEREMVGGYPCMMSLGRKMSKILREISLEANFLYINFLTRLEGCRAGS